MSQYKRLTTARRALNYVPAAPAFPGYGFLAVIQYVAALAGVNVSAGVSLRLINSHYREKELFKVVIFGSR